MSKSRVSFILFPLSLPGLMKKEAALKERNKFRMCEYCTQLPEKKNAIKLYDHNRKWEQKSNQVNINNSIPSYKNVLYQSKRICELLGGDHKVHSHILSHVLKHSFYSPKKRKSVAKWCKALLKCLESELDSKDDFKMPLKNFNEMLRKVAVYQSTKKLKKAKNIVEEINSQESNISSMATLSGSKYSDVYRLIKTPKRHEVYKEYKQRFSDEQKIEATNIYLNEEVSYCLSDRKYSKLCFMFCTIKEAYKNHYLV